MKANGTIQAVIFDLGGVLIDFDFNRANRRIAEITGLQPDEIRRRILSCSGFLDFECGRISEREFHACVEKVLGHSIPFSTFHELWNFIFSDEIAPTVALVPELRRSVKVGLLSNTNALHFEHLKTRMRVLSEMDHVFASHEIGHRKPDAEAYQHVLKEMKVPAQHAVFVDDLAENIAAARQVGMIGIHASSAANVAAGLKDLGLLK